MSTKVHVHTVFAAPRSPSTSSPQVGDCRFKVLEYLGESDGVSRGNRTLQREINGTGSTKIIKNLNCTYMYSTCI